jgi:hypothetical protein
MILICLFEFETQNDGVLKMQTFDYPCAFIVGSDVFDYQGNPLVISDTYFIAPNNTMEFIVGFGDEDTPEGLLYVQDNICKVNKIN